MSSDGSKQKANDEKGQDVRTTNILAARAVADTVRTSLGPKGMDKMIQDLCPLWILGCVWGLRAPAERP